MAYNEANFAVFSGGDIREDLPTQWRYSSTGETLATIKGSGYFLLTESDTNLMLLAKVNDLVYIEGSDGTDWVKFSSVTAPVTVSSDVDAPSLTQGDLAVGDANNEISALSGTAGQIVQYNASANAVAATMSGDVTLSNTAVASVGKVLDGGNVANLADDAVLGGLPVIFTVTTAAGATANTDITVTNKIKVLDAWVQPNGAGTVSDTLQILNSTNAITNAMDINVADKTLVRAGTIDDAYATIAAAGTLRVTVTDGGGADVPATEVRILAINVA